ncbi:MAG: ABC transporter ATP-binding protein [Isosphaeraceae bacterium]
MPTSCETHKPLLDLKKRMKPIIRVENLGKQYRIGRREARYATIRESLVQAAVSPINRLRRALNHSGNGSADSEGHIWALKDVGFEVKPGEVVGIIGRNGAGKSTLLKILSRVTEPTEGKVDLYGRVGSLLEVGTGFHPELTGRENVYLNGSILGMSRREIDRKFDEIVAFAEIEQFLDTAVKRYSSGMYLRLAFAVAAHLEPEILMVDEVLAVGDATYQKRCIDRMNQIARSGRSVLFVSHNMDLIPRLCERAILLERGHVAVAGPASQVVRDYLEDTPARFTDEDLSRKPRFGDGRARFTHIWLVGPDGSPKADHASGDDLRVRVRIQSHIQIPNAALALNVLTATGARIHSGWTREVGFPFFLNPGNQEYECHFLAMRLRPGQRMTIGLWLEAGDVVDCVEDALTFEILEGHGTEFFSTDRLQGVVLCNYEWSRVDDKTVPRSRDEDICNSSPAAHY